MQTLEIKVQKPDPRACPYCGKLVKPRGEKLPGRYYCANHAEGTAEFIITKEYFSNLVLGPELVNKSFDDIIQSFEIKDNRWPSVVKKIGYWKCHRCGKDITEKKVASFLVSGNDRPHYLHVSCAQGMGLKVTEEALPT